MILFTVNELKSIDLQRLRMRKEKPMEISVNFLKAGKWIEYLMYLIIDLVELTVPRACKGDIKEVTWFIS